MQRLSVQSFIRSLIALIVALTTTSVLAFGSAASAGSTLVGLATAQGKFWVNHAPMAGSASLYDGSSIDTGSVENEVRLSSGARLNLAAGTRGVLYRDRLVLEQGRGQVGNLSAYGIEAGSLRIGGAGRSSAAVAVLATNRVQVAALSGAVRVSNAAGIVVANLAPGRVLEFSPEQSGAAAPTRVTGCVVEHGGAMKLTDDVSAVTFVLKGKDLSKHLKSHAELTGVIDPASKQESVLLVSGARTLSARCSDRQVKEALAKAAGAGAAASGAATSAATAGTAAGVSTGAIVAGVGVAAAAAGTAIAVVASDDAPISPSRP